MQLFLDDVLLSSAAVDSAGCGDDEDVAGLVEDCAEAEFKVDGPLSVVYSVCHVYCRVLPGGRSSHGVATTRKASGTREGNGGQADGAWWSVSLVCWPTVFLPSVLLRLTLVMIVYGGAGDAEDGDACGPSFTAGGRNFAAPPSTVACFVAGSLSAVFL